MWLVYCAKLPMKEQDLAVFSTRREARRCVKELLEWNMAKFKPTIVQVRRA